ncbi:MAG: hypothetical protein WCR20_13270 [Verrucomicrobiota bacterium]
MTTAQLNTCFDGYLSEMNLEDFLEFLGENNVNYAKVPWIPLSDDKFWIVIPNHPNLTKRYFKKDHSQFER